MSEVIEFIALFGMGLIGGAVGDGKLAGDDCGGAPLAVFEDFQEVPAHR